MSRDVAAVVLAAGKGTRFKSDLAKVLHRAAGRTLIRHALEALRPLSLHQIVVVVGHQAEDVVAEIQAADVPNTTTVVQPEQRGTGHAVAVAMPAIDGQVERVLVIPGDHPLLVADTLTAALDASAEADAAVLTTELDDPTGYGRIVRQDGRVIRIVEQRDASDEEREIREINGGLYLLPRKRLEPALAQLSSDNEQGEQYLTDVIERFVDEGLDVRAVTAPIADLTGVNDRAQLADVEAVLRARRVRELQLAGVTVIDPSTTYIDMDVEIGRDTVLLPGCLLEAGTRIGQGVTLGPSCRLRASEIGDGATVMYAVLDHASVGPDATVGPYTYLRPGTRLGRGAKAGGFVEMKNAVVGEGSKVPHLSYIGDAEIGRDANIGAGTITCNYDGFDKHRTEVGDGAFIGSDTMLVAPVRVGRGAVTGAGSAITEDVPDDALAVERSEQRNIEGWAAARREKHD